MKTIRNLFLYIPLAMSCVMCGSDAEEPIVPVDSERDGLCTDGGIYDFDFEVVDKTTGADLLDPAVEGNILDQPIRVFYNGETYDRITVDDLQYYPPRGPAAVSPGSRTMMLLPLALRWGFNGNGIVDCYQLSFGEWSSHSTEIRDIRFTIDWGDGTRNEIEVGERKEEIDGILWTIFTAIVDGREMPYMSVRIER